jgi:hypothetical protein
MATEKKFSVAGVSTLNGKTKIRFANDALRIKVLEKNGHSNVELVNLPHEMTKGEIAAHLQATGFMADNAAVVEAIAYVAKKNKLGGPAASTTEAPSETVVAA